ncbi:MAG: hypothetical protein IJR14_05015 [Synergistaceae bacterium]|nr:hypothetical protein [Synergistaceae bacterium]
MMAPFPYEEDRTIVKMRPCLILGVDEKRSRFLAAKITTTEVRAWWGIPLSAGTADMISGMILRPSWVDLHRREWIPFSDCAFRIGRIRPDLFDDQIMARLRGL